MGKKEVICPDCGVNLGKPFGRLTPKQLIVAHKAIYCSKGYHNKTK